MAERDYWRHESERERRGYWRRDSDDDRYYARRADHDHYRGGRDVDEHRDWTDKASDEVKSWFGSGRAERRREMDRAREYRREQERRDFTGVGPRLRHNEDDELREAINHRLAEDSRLDASGIIVRVLDNEAILDGVVASQRDARWAHDLALDVPGVVAVRDRIRVDARALERERERRLHEHDDRYGRDHARDDRYERDYRRDDNRYPRRWG
jgi:osmotically-inducible protein OsmY